MGYDPDPTIRFTTRTWRRRHARDRLDLPFWLGVGLGCLVAGLVLGCAIYRISQVVGR